MRPRAPHAPGGPAAVHPRLASEHHCGRCRRPSASRRHHLLRSRVPSASASRTTRTVSPSGSAPARCMPSSRRMRDLADRAAEASLDASAWKPWNAALGNTALHCTATPHPPRGVLLNRRRDQGLLRALMEGSVSTSASDGVRGGSHSCRRRHAGQVCSKGCARPLNHWRSRDDERARITSARGAQPPA